MKTYDMEDTFSRPKFGVPDTRRHVSICVQHLNMCKPLFTSKNTCKNF